MCVQLCVSECVTAQRNLELLTTLMKHSPWASRHDSRPYVIITTESVQTEMKFRYTHMDMQMCVGFFRLYLFNGPKII